MTVRLEGQTIHLEGPCRVEDAEPLLTMMEAGLRDGAQCRVDLAQAGPLHTAVVQVLLHWRPAVLGTPADPFAAQWLVPLLQARQSG